MKNYSLFSFLTNRSNKSLNYRFQNPRWSNFISTDELFWKKLIGILSSRGFQGRFSENTPKKKIVGIHMTSIRLYNIIAIDSSYPQILKQFRTQLSVNGEAVMVQPGPNPSSSECWSLVEHDSASPPEPSHQPGKRTSGHTSCASSPYLRNSEVESKTTWGVL